MATLRRNKSDQFDAAHAALSERTKALTHPARLAILQVLAQRETCICGDLVDELPLAQSTVSNHLKVLRDAGLVQGTIDGPRVCYCIDPEGLRALHEQWTAFVQPLLNGPAVQSSSKASTTDCC
ncbi:ArsR/SmtB family transcription factor [Salisaeta longa]|uniref:ArsR/SmtB family transcription factor n=1 Tax=Salisaeta longa TaxID=503170 RepID=UPI0003B615EA|nr:metalloregulator ArsR/SmtB family transcription factor [Salisaeta longa]